MNNEEKVYYPQIAPDYPFPVDTGSQPPTQIITQPQSGGVYRSPVIQDSRMPQKVIAHETISQALNTKSKNILQQFDLVDSGGFRIGKYQNGVSGELILTPRGLTAKDMAGNTTFGIDGETGDAVFKGQIQSGSLITGDVIIQPGGSIFLGDQTTIIDEHGLVSSTNFRNGDATKGSDFATTSTSYVDIPELSLVTPAFNRTVTVIMFLQVLLQIESNNLANDFEGGCNIVFLVDGQIPDYSMIMERRSIRNQAVPYTDGVKKNVSMAFHVMDLVNLTGQPESRTIKAQIKVFNGTGTGQATVYNGSKLSFIVLGT